MLTVVLVVDENRNIREFCRRELERDGYHVFVVGDTREALRLLGEIRVDLIVADPADEPGMDFLTFLGAASRCGIPVVTHTDPAASQSDDLRRMAEALVEKNGDLTKLKREIEKVVERKAAGTRGREGSGCSCPLEPSGGCGSGKGVP